MVMKNVLLYLQKKKILLTVLYIFNFSEHFLRNPILGSSHF